MRSIFYVALLCLILFQFDELKAQHQDVNERPEMYKSKDANDVDSGSILGAFK